MNGLIDLSAIEEKLKQGNVELDMLKEAVQRYEELGLELLKILDYAVKCASGDEREKLEKLYRQFARKNLSDLCETLRKRGRSLRTSSPEGVYKRFFDEGPTGLTFRLLELTRLGKREEVFHLLLREFVAAGEEMPFELVKAFDPIYSTEVFKTFVYSFLGGLLGPVYESSTGGISDEQSE
ncbi:hypothetical protein ACSFC1_10050 [Pseudothermotoga sp. U03pept]|uniref:hypothetical protein n=1 Tax=Pseudothermotoga sp. U03pept TaxID=3447012 RepID=UPI003F0DFC85